MEIIQGTTPTFIFTFTDISASDISVAYFHIAQSGSVVIEKELTDATVDTDENTMSFTLTQAESLSLSTKIKAKVSLDWKLASGIRGRSAVYEASVLVATKDEVI